MPVAANITVKKFDGTTDIVYNTLTGAGSDGTPAVWRQDTGAPATLPIGLRAVLWLKSLWNGPKTARRLPFRYEYPYSVQDSTTGKWSATDRVVIEGFALIPQGIPPDVAGEGVYQGLNLISNVLIKQSMTAGYAPN